MKKAIVAKKIGMTQVFNQETGEMIPVTVPGSRSLCGYTGKDGRCMTDTAPVQVGFGRYP